MNSGAEGEAVRAPLGLLLFWAAILLAIPFYVFPSGTAQPADLAMLLVLGLSAVTGFARLRGDVRTTVLRLVAYTGVVATVNFTWTLLWAWTSNDFLRSTLFAVFNLVVFTGFVTLADRYGAPVVRWTAWATALSLIGQAALSTVFANRSDGHRLVLFFNNPNQLAFYALGAASLVLLVASIERLPRLLIVSTCVAAGWLLFRSYSRAAGIGFVVLLTLFIVRRPSSVLLALGPFALVGFFADNLLVGDDLWQMRMAAVRQGDVSDYVEDRGLERIFEFPLYTLLGAGEGMHLRFHPLGLELHSSFASVVFSYGVAGVMTLAAFGYSLYGKLPIRSAVLLAPTVLYSFFHNGMRFRTFWLLLAVATALGILADARPRSGGPGAGQNATDSGDHPLQVGFAHRRPAR